MLRLAGLLDVDLLQRHIEDGNVAVKQHPTLPLKLLTYTRQAQYTQTWDDVTTRCRGLVIESEADQPVDPLAAVIAQPFEKFYNYAEHAAGKPYARPLPTSKFEIYDKVDGSLAIVFHYRRNWHVATKGSFTSDQAVWAKQHLDSKPEATSDLDSALTYMAEIIYPENRIVVDYGARTDLVLLGVRNKGETPHYLNMMPLETVQWQWSRIGSIAYRYPPMSIPELLSHAQANTDIGNFGPDDVPVAGTELEGFVLAWSNGVRCKIKYSEYVTLHSIMTGLRTVDVWRAVGASLLGEKTQSTAKEAAQALSCSPEEAAALLVRNEDGGAFERLMDAVPDEVDETVKELAVGYCIAAQETHEAIGTLFELRPEETTNDRAAYACWVKGVTNDLSSVVRSALFLMFDGNVDKVVRFIWKTIMPESKPVFKEAAADE